MATSGAFIAVHAGAGFHSLTKEEDYRKTCRDACLQAVQKFKAGGNAQEALTTAVSILEDDPLTNAGVGSNLTLDGQMECDASLMDGKSLIFGAVGCLSGVKNPIQVASKLVSNQHQGVLSLGRIPPSVLVGDGARSWAQQNGVEVVAADSLITEASKRTYMKYKRKLENSETSVGTNSKYLKKEEGGISIKESVVHDTVGAVCVDCHGNVAAGVSSGGIWLKQSGRLGPAAVYGAGCWAHNGRGADIPGVAVATSGSGEHLMKTLLAKTCGDHVQREENASHAVGKVFKEDFIESEFLSDLAEKHGGALVLKKETCEGKIQVELLWAHTTDSMCIGYMSHSNQQLKTFISRLPEGSTPGKSLAMEGKLFRL